MRSAKEEYGDILYREHPSSRKHPPMSRAARAAQFAPFAALTGYDEMIADSARERTQPVSLEEDRRAELDRRLRLLLRETPSPEAEFTYYEYSRKQGGGAYVTKTGRLLRCQPQEEYLELEDGTVIFLRDLRGIESPVFDELL